jgi:hypothetical protein
MDDDDDDPNEDDPGPSAIRATLGFVGIVLGWTAAGVLLGGLIAFLIGWRMEPNGAIAEITLAASLLGAVVGSPLGIIVGFLRARRWLWAWGTGR